MMLLPVLVCCWVHFLVGVTTAFDNFDRDSSHPHHVVASEFPTSNIVEEKEYSGKPRLRLQEPLLPTVEQAANEEPTGHLDQLQQPIQHSKTNHAGFSFSHTHTHIHCSGADAESDDCSNQHEGAPQTTTQAAVPQTTTEAGPRPYWRTGCPSVIDGVEPDYKNHTILAGPLPNDVSPQTVEAAINSAKKGILQQTQPDVAELTNRISLDFEKTTGGVPRANWVVSCTAHWRQQGARLFYKGLFLKFELGDLRLIVFLG